MRPLLLLLALFLMLLSGCSTVQPSAPAKIDPPPVALVTACATPDDLKQGATAQDLALWTVAWIGTAGCERAKRQALVESWPR
jgi:uncharacterized protein YceK